MTVCTKSKQRLAVTNEDLVNRERENTQKPEEFTDEFRTKIAKAIEADDLCYNCETGFHYMKQ